MEKKKGKSLQDLYLHPKLSPGLVPYRLFKEYIGIVCRKKLYEIIQAYLTQLTKLKLGFHQQRQK